MLPLINCLFFWFEIRRLLLCTPHYPLKGLERIRINVFCVELAGNTYEDLLALATASVDSKLLLAMLFICFHLSIIIIVVDAMHKIKGGHDSKLASTNGLWLGQIL
ncbi:hypothetical protein QVD17_39560 [Tagetes erecta]|uniref:Uncharacterized protein n=1 Tax=Tagetes erecta TaxID=13708 RepID=A0AAD8JNS2_TARER|nr:hypothetical protein QVD17_39560 [Tagetes erecta]